VIIRNAAMCNKCGVAIQSTHVHDYIECPCGESFVDGGNSYFRYGGDITPLFMSTETKFVPDSAELENSDVVMSAHHPDTCVGTVCTLHKRTDHSMRGWEQSAHMVGSTIVMTRICPHGAPHTDPDDFFIYDLALCIDCDAPKKEIVYA